MREIVYWLGVTALSHLARESCAFSIVPADTRRLLTGARQRHFCLSATKTPLASEGSWDAYLDNDGTGFIYYFNRDTGESLWEKPTSTFPDVELEGTLRKEAAEKQNAYLETLKEKVAKEEKKGFFANMMKKDPADDGGEQWFSSLFENNKSAASFNKSAATTVAEPEPVVEPGPQSDGFFANLFKPREEVAYSSTDSSSTTSRTDIASTDAPSKVETPARLEATSYVLPHPAKQLWGGEDAIMIKGRTFGVFDGVSGAEKVDGVPLYSKTLALEFKKRVSKEESLSVQQLTKLLLECAEIADDAATGASTAIVASIGHDGFLRALNVGDSSCVVVRDGKIAARTREISHYFDCPYQLSADSPDRPRDGTRLNLELMRNDIIIMGSDGVFDNLGDEQIIEVVQSESSPSKLAKKLSDVSRKVSNDRSAPTPYARQAKQYGDPDYKDGLGGKVDDVSCIVVTYK